MWASAGSEKSQKLSSRRSRKHLALSRQAVLGGVSSQQAADYGGRVFRQEVRRDLEGFAFERVSHLANLDEDELAFRRPQLPDDAHRLPLIGREVKELDGAIDLRERVARLEVRVRDERGRVRDDPIWVVGVTENDVVGGERERDPIVKVAAVTRWAHERVRKRIPVVERSGAVCRANQSARERHCREPNQKPLHVSSSSPQWPVDHLALQADAQERSPIPTSLIRGFGRAFPPNRG